MLQTPPVIFADLDAGRLALSFKDGVNGFLAMPDVGIDSEFVPVKVGPGWGDMGFELTGNGRRFVDQVTAYVTLRLRAVLDVKP